MGTGNGVTGTEVLASREVALHSTTQVAAEIYHD